jgi:ketosteroid isomerase-like protein
MNFSKRNLLAVAALSAATTTAPRADDSPPPASGAEVPFAVWAAINAATQGYADCLDRFDIPGLMALFSPDCVYDYAPSVFMKGRDQVAEGARKALSNVTRSSHFVGPPVVQAAGEPNVYTSTVYFTAFHQQKDGGQHTVYGRYLDTFKPDPTGRLLITHRQTVSHASEGISGPRYWLPRLPS